MNAGDDDEPVRLLFLSGRPGGESSSPNGRAPLAFWSRPE